MSILSIGQSAPAFSLSGTDGKSYTLNQNGARLTLAVFFKITCPTSAMTWAYLDKLYHSFRGVGLAVWGISQDGREGSARFAAANGGSFPILIDAGWRVSRTFDPDFVPTALLIGPDGKIVDTMVGFDKSKLNHMSQTIAARLGVPPVMIAPPDDGKPAFRPG